VIKTLTFFTNFIHHHQVYVADEFYKKLGSNYTFVITKALPYSFTENGYPDFSNRPYILNAFENAENYQKALFLGKTSDVVIIGAAPDVFIKERLKDNKITFRYSERWFKKIDFHLFSPRAWWYKYYYHLRHRGKRLYMLCASAYLANDTAKLFSYPQKCYKWGYFTNVEQLNIDVIIQKKQQPCFKIFWAARWIPLKHPEFVILLAADLKKKGYNFHIEMAGTGSSFFNEEIKSLALKLNVLDKITFLDSVPNHTILKKMQEANVFLFTSNGEEGWGAVVNEAMSNGCTVIASHKIGSVPFLIKNRNTGLIFKTGDVQGLIKCVELLLTDRNFCNELAKNAYYSISHIWNPKNAATCFLSLSSSLMDNEEKICDIGPCSKAFPIKKREFLKSIQ
jgi:glycosyltransferase involved in cell wall biosynthesis